jgi:flagellar assembly factor FliW
MYTGGITGAKQQWHPNPPRCEDVQHLEVKDGQEVTHFIVHYTYSDLMLEFILADPKVVSPQHRVEV